MAIRNVNDLYTQLSQSEDFAALFSSPEDFATTLQSMSPERQEAFYNKLGVEAQVSKDDFLSTLKKKDESADSLFTSPSDGGEQPGPVNPFAPRKTLLPTATGPIKGQTWEERFPTTPEQKKALQAPEAIQRAQEEAYQNRNIYTPPQKKVVTQEELAQSRQLEQERQWASDMPQIQTIDFEAIDKGKAIVADMKAKSQAEEDEQIIAFKQDDNSLFKGIDAGQYEYRTPEGISFDLDEYAIGRALFEGDKLEIFSKGTGQKVDVRNPQQNLLDGRNNYNYIDENSIKDNLIASGFTEEQADNEILRLKQQYVAVGAKTESDNLKKTLLAQYGNQGLANQAYINYWHNRSFDMLQGSEKEAYAIVQQMEILRKKMLEYGVTGTVTDINRQLESLQNQLSELRDNPNNLYDWRTGEFVDTRIQDNRKKVQDIQKENESFQIKYSDQPKDVLVKRRDELMAQRSFIINKMAEDGLDIPEEGSWNAISRSVMASIASQGSGLIYLPDGRQVDAEMYKRKMEDYNSQLYSVMRELYGLNRAVMLNENVALRKQTESLMESVVKNLGIAAESIGREFVPGLSTEDANSEFNTRNSVLDALEQSGYTVPSGLRSAASASVAETISGSAGMLADAMVQIALGNMLVPEITAMRWAKGFNNLLKTKYGKTGEMVFANTSDMIRQGAIFQAAGQGFATGAGEAVGQMAVNALNLEKLFASGSRIPEFLVRTIAGGTAETVQEYAGQYLQVMIDNGIDIDKNFRDAFGHDMESALDQLLVIGITSAGFSGAANLKILTATNAKLRQILEDPTQAALYGEVLTEEKKKEVEQVLKIVEDKIADKQTRQTNDAVVSAESSEHVPYEPAGNVEDQINTLNEQRKQALEELYGAEGPQSQEQQAEYEQKVAAINQEFDQRISDITPKTATFESVTGNNKNAVLGSADLQSEATQEFLANIKNPRERKNAATLIAIANNANSTLQSVLPGVNIVLHTTDSFRQKMKDIGERANRKGNFSIVENLDGTRQIEIQIDLEKGNYADIAHEVTHGILYNKFFNHEGRDAEIARAKKAHTGTDAEWSQTLNDINTKYDTEFSEVFKEFKDKIEKHITQQGGAYLNRFANAYSTTDQAEEWITEFTAMISKNAETIAQEDPGFFQRLLAIINKIIKSIGKEAGIKFQEFKDTQEVLDFFNTIAESIRKGEGIKQAKVSKKEAAPVTEQPTTAQPGAEVRSKARLTEISPVDFSTAMELKYGITLDLMGNQTKGDLSLSRIVVPEDSRGQGVGQQVMQEIIAYADANNRRIVLTPSTDFGGTSVSRLVNFYKQFGFVENKGANKDFTTKEAMYREPQPEVKSEAKPTEEFFSSIEDKYKESKLSIKYNEDENGKISLGDIKYKIGEYDFAGIIGAKKFVDDLVSFADENDKTIVINPKKLFFQNTDTTYEREVMHYYDDAEYFAVAGFEKVGETWVRKPKTINENLKQYTNERPIEEIGTSVEESRKPVTEQELTGIVGKEIANEATRILEVMGWNPDAEIQKNGKFGYENKEVEGYERIDTDVIDQFFQNWSKENNVYLENPYDVFDKNGLQRLGKGTESVVYIGSDSKYVYKLTHPNKMHWNTLDFLIKTQITNSIFPESAVEILGFTDFYHPDTGSEFGIVTKQPFHEPWPDAVEVSDNDIETFIKSLGFDVDIDEGGYVDAYKKSLGLTLLDLHGENLYWAKGQDGQPYIAVVDSSLGYFKDFKNKGVSYQQIVFEKFKSKGRVEEEPVYESTEDDFQLPFGKYKGEWFTTTPRAYQSWLFKQDWFQPKDYLKPKSQQEQTKDIQQIRNKARTVEFDKNTQELTIDGVKVNIPSVLYDVNNSIPNALAFASESEIPTNLEFKRALQDRFNSSIPMLKKQYGENFDPKKENDALKAYLVDAYVFETLVAMKSFPDALGWYDAKTKAAMEIMSLIHPEIKTDPIAAGMFKIAVAVTSNGNKVIDNFIEADRQYNYFKDNGRFDESRSIGTQSAGIKSTFVLANEILKTLPKDKFIKFLTSKFKAGELKYRDAKGSLQSIATGFNGDTVVFGASIFGPKIGNGFFMNLYGDFSQLTMDRWFMRQYGRLTGRLIDVDPAKVTDGTNRLKETLKALSTKEKNILEGLIPNYRSYSPTELSDKIAKVSGKVEKREILQQSKNLDEVRKAGNSLSKNTKGEIEAPKNGTQRNFIISVFDEVQSKLKNEYGLDITIADLQAVNWYPEKALYQTFQKGRTEELGAEETSDNEQPDYESAAKKLAKSYGYSEKEINKQLTNQDGTRKFDTGGNQEFGRDHSDVGVELVKQEILDTTAKLKAAQKTKSKGRIEPWSTPQQEISSAGTSINKAKLPSVYSDKKFLNILKAVPGDSIVIADIGSGKYANQNIKPLLEKGEIAEFINESSKKMLSEKAIPALEEVLGNKEISYFPYDPFNQPAEVNEETISMVRDGNADVAVSPNVLNVIAEAEAREGVIANMANAVGTKGTAVFQIYEGDPKDRGVGKETKTAGETSWQNNQATAWYVPEIQAYFANVTRSGNIILADNRGQVMEGAKVDGNTIHGIKNKARIEEKVKESKAYGIPQRYKGDVGKMIGGELYVHKSANDVLPQQALINAESKLPEDFEYEVIKYNAADGSFSFIASPDWDSASEPIVGDAYKVKKNGEVSVTKQKADPQIYHHKWNFVRDNYNGFDIQQSIQRSIDWYRDAKEDINMYKIGTQSYWNENAVPLIKDTTKIINKGRVAGQDVIDDWNDLLRNGFSGIGAYYELQKIGYTPGEIKRYIPEMEEYWSRAAVNKFARTIRKHKNKIRKRQEKIRVELGKYPQLSTVSMYDVLKKQGYEDFEIYKAFYEEGFQPSELDDIFGENYRQTIEKTLKAKTAKGKLYNRDFLREVKNDARSRKLVDMADQMNRLFGFTNGVIDNEAMIDMMAEALEETGMEFALLQVTNDIREKRKQIEQDIAVFKQISRGEVDPNTQINVARLLSLAGRMLRMGKGLFDNQQNFEEAIFRSLENITYKTEVAKGENIKMAIVRQKRAFKLTPTQKNGIRKKIQLFREAKAKYDAELDNLQIAPASAYTDAQYEIFDKTKIEFEQAARALKLEIDKFRRKSNTRWFTSMEAVALLSFRTVVIGAIGNLEMYLANKGYNTKLFGWSRRLANKITAVWNQKDNLSAASELVKRGAMADVDSNLYRSLAWNEGVQQIRNILENTIAESSTSQNGFLNGQNQIDSMSELVVGGKMLVTLMKNVFKREDLKMSDEEWANMFDEMLLMLNEKDANGKYKLETMDPKGYTAATTLLRGIFGYIPTAVGKSIALSGDRVFYKMGYYEALASFAASQGITDPAEIKKFIRLNSAPGKNADFMAERAGSKRIFANDNKLTDWVGKRRSSSERRRKQITARKIFFKTQKKPVGKENLKLAANAAASAGGVAFSPFTRIPPNFMIQALRKTVPGWALVDALLQQSKLTTMMEEYENLFGLDKNAELTPYQLKEQEKMRQSIFEQQRAVAQGYVDTFQAMQVAAFIGILLMSGAIGAPYGDDPDERKAARAANIANQPPGKINITHLLEWMSGKDVTGRTYQKGDFTINYVNAGMVGFAMSYISSLYYGAKATERANENVMGMPDEMLSSITTSMIAESITNGITSLSFIQTIASAISAIKSKEQGFENILLNLSKTILTVPTMAYGVFGAVEKAEGITVDSMRNYYPDLEPDEAAMGVFRAKLWTSLTGRSPISLFGLKNSKGEFLSPFASPFYVPQIGPHGEELYKKNTFWDVRSGELSDRVAAYIQASFDPFSMSTYEGFVSSVKTFDNKEAYKPGDIIEYNGEIYGVKKNIASGSNFKNLVSSEDENADIEYISTTTKFFDKEDYMRNKLGTIATENLFNLISMYQEATGSRKDYQVLTRFYDPYLKAKDAQGEFSIYIPLKYQKELALLRGDIVRNSYDQQQIQEQTQNLQRLANELEDEEYYKIAEEQIETILYGPMNPTTYERSGGIVDAINKNLSNLESTVEYREIQRKALLEGLANGVFTEEQYLRMANAEGLGPILQGLPKEKLKFKE